MGTTTNRALPYPAPSDLVTNGAAAMQALAEGIDDELGPRTAFSAHLPASANITANAWTDLTSWTEHVDDAGALSAGVFTAPVAGLYMFTASVFWQGNTSGARYLSFWRKTGAGAFTEQPGNSCAATVALDSPRLTGIGLFWLAAGDQVKPAVFQSSNATLYVQGGTDGATGVAQYAGLLLRAA